MALKLSSADLPQLMSWLEQYLPQSFRVLGYVKSQIRGRHTMDMDFWVDTWPHPQALVAREDVPVTRLALEEMKISFSEVTAILLKATPQDLKPRARILPAGLKFQAVSETEARTICTTWKYSQFASETYMKKQIEESSSVYLATEHGRHVGHMICRSYGTIGLLFVNPEFRGKGYAKIIVSQLAQNLFDRGDDAVYVFIEEDNIPSRNLHEAMGFREVSGGNSTWLFCSESSRK
ncbi:hypothetical protein ACOMHN_018485 [Nucella lapillus]